MSRLLCNSVYSMLRSHKNTTCSSVRDKEKQGCFDRLATRAVVCSLTQPHSCHNVCWLCFRWEQSGPGARCQWRATEGPPGRCCQGREELCCPTLHLGSSSLAPISTLIPRHFRLEINTAATCGLPPLARPPPASAQGCVSPQAILGRASVGEHQAY